MKLSQMHASLPQFQYHASLDECLGEFSPTSLQPGNIEQFHCMVLCISRCL